MERPRHYWKKVTVLLLLILVWSAFALFNLSILPPPRLILSYGLPLGGPTGTTWTNEQGMVFAEVDRGYFLHEPGPNSVSTKSRWLEVKGPMWVCTGVPSEDLTEAYEIVARNPSRYKIAGLNEQFVAWQIADGVCGSILLRARPPGQ
jgi:hypothetical protein